MFHFDANHFVGNQRYNDACGWCGDVRFLRELLQRGVPVRQWSVSPASVGVRRPSQLSGPNRRDQLQPETQRCGAENLGRCSYAPNSSDVTSSPRMWWAEKRAVWVPVQSKPPQELPSPAGTVWGCASPAGKLHLAKLSCFRSPSAVHMAFVCGGRSRHHAELPELQPGGSGCLRV